MPNMTTMQEFLYRPGILTIGELEANVEHVVSRPRGGVGGEEIALPQPITLDRVAVSRLPKREIRRRADAHSSNHGQQALAPHGRSTLRVVKCSR